MTHMGAPRGVRFGEARLELEFHLHMGVPRGQLNTSPKTHPAMLQQATKSCTFGESSDDGCDGEGELLSSRVLTKL